MTDDGKPTGRSRANVIARRLLTIWTVGCLVVACGPGIVAGAFGSASGAALGGSISLAATAALFVPWLIGAVVLGAIVLATN